MMMGSETNMRRLLAGEIIGCSGKIIKSGQSGLAGKKFTIIDDTKNMLICRIDGQDKKIIKSNAEFEIIIDDEKVTVKGEEICIRPKERTKVMLTKRS